MSKKILSLLMIIVLCYSCLPNPQSKHLTYQNIVIISDMSSRINSSKFPHKDIQEIDNIIQYFRNECVKPGAKIGDKSSISFSAFSEKTGLAIDIGKIKDLGEKQSFINSTGKFKDSGLDKILLNFKDTVNSLYKRISNPGLDLISLLIEKIENEDIIKKDNVITDGIDSTYIYFDNHIYVFTDGYLEYQLNQRNLNNEYYFGETEIDRVRKYCIANEIDASSALKKDKSLGLPVSTITKSKYINLHIFETHERDKDVKSQSYRYPTGLRDNDILRAVWEKWSIESGFKSFEWKKY